MNTAYPLLVNYEILIIYYLLFAYYILHHLYTNTRTTESQFCKDGGIF
jgi:hypothetical protein